MLGNSIGYAATGCLLMAMGGCAVFKGQVTEPPSTSGQAATGTRRESGSEQAAGPAAQALMAQAASHVETGDYQKAAATLERALYIEPRNPVIYAQLADVMLAQGLLGEAENLARRSNSLARNQPDLQAKNWMTIARAMRARGETASAEAAEMRARELKNLAGE